MKINGNLDAARQIKPHQIKAGDTTDTYSHREADKTTDVKLKNDP